MTTVINQWAPQVGYERRTLPTTSDNWSPTESHVARYLLHLKVLGIDDPTKATTHYQSALSLREHTITVAAKPNEEAAIATALALGEISREEATKRLAKTPTPSDAEEFAARGRQMLQTATRNAYVNAVQAIHFWGEDKWLALLRPLCEEAVAARDDERFKALHNFAGLLRDHNISALAMVASDTAGIREFEETWRYTVGRPDLYHAWRLKHAERVHVASHDAAGEYMFVTAVVTKGPHPRLADMGEMEPGLYSAAEVLSIKNRIVAEQHAAHDGAEPTPRKKRGVVMI